MTAPTLHKFLEVLIEKTNSGTIKWFQGEEENVFRCGVQSCVIRVKKPAVPGLNFLLPSEIEYELLIADGNGNPLEKLVSNTNKDNITQEVFECARRSALDIDSKLSLMLDDLQNERVQQKLPQDVLSNQHVTIVNTIINDILSDHPNFKLSQLTRMSFGFKIDIVRRVSVSDRASSAEVQEPQKLWTDLLATLAERGYFYEKGRLDPKGELEIYVRIVGAK